MIIDTSGNVGIGTTSFGSATGPVLAILNNGATGPSAVAGQGILWSNAGAGTWRGPTTSTQFAAADYAEEMPTTGTVEQAEIVSVSLLLHKDADDIHNRFFVERSTKPYDPYMVGIVSSFAPDTLTNSKMVGLVGRVPLKISTESGAIKTGDRITSSSLPGVGMKATKAGQTVGIALQPFDGTQASSTTQLLPDGKPVTTGKVLVFVNVGYQGNDLSLSANDNQLQVSSQPIIDKSGKDLALTHEGAIVVRKLVTLDLEIAKGGKFTLGKGAQIELPKGSNELVGRVTVPEGLTYAIMENQQVRPESSVFLTLRGTPPDGVTYGVASAKEGQFTIQLSRGAPYALDFEYWILNTYDAGAAIPVTTGQATSTAP